MPKSGKSPLLSAATKKCSALEDLQAAILDGTAPYISLEETRNHVRTVLALYDSARTGKKVKLQGSPDVGFITS
ncbi:MAG: hypothetical protein V3R33_03535 [Anaerolineales bacterium]